MNKENSYIPDWDNCDNWTESDWENALKYSDDLASQYFHMLERYGDLPYAEDLIAKKLNDKNMVRCDDVFGDYEWYIDSKDDDDLVDADFDLGESQPGDSLFYETSPIYQKASQITLGWCNVLSSVLSPNDRFWGLNVLFYMGRMLSFISLSISDGTYEHINGNMIFTKRALSLVNQILGKLNSMEKKCSRYSTVFKIVQEHLLECHDLLVDYLMECKKRQNNRKKG